MNTRAGKAIVIVFFGVAFFSQIILLTSKWNSTIAKLAEQYCKSTGLAVESVKLDFIRPNLTFPIQNTSLISIDFECLKDKSLIKQLVHELMTCKMLMELYTLISTVAQKLVLTPLTHFGAEAQGGVLPPPESPRGGYYPLYPPPVYASAYSYKTNV